MPESHPALARLEARLRAIRPAAVAVSGGVDSMTLACVAHRTLRESSPRMFHAVSAAVPPDATQRVERHATREGWRLEIIDAGELADPRYLANPVNRCYFCKTNLYDTMAGRTDGVIVAGTNLDDLGDYRPGLTAAAEHAVRHPFVEAEIDKSTVRAIARQLGLVDLAELPAAPCLSSRVETGIAIEPRTLSAIDAAEKLVSQVLTPTTVRCRVRAESIVIELDEATLGRLDAATLHDLETRIATLAGGAGGARPVRFALYRMGSAFLRGRSDA